MKKILLIINPVAGKSRIKVRSAPIGEWFARKGYTATLLHTAGKGDAKDFVLQYAAENDAVVCCGGDGTLNEVISGMIESGTRKPIGYLPAGTTNDMARTLRLPSNLKKAATVVMTGQPAEQDIGNFNGTRIFSYIASFGAFTKVSYATPQWLKNRFGHLAYILDGIRDAGSIRPHRLSVVSDELEDEGDYVFGSISNSSSIGGTIRLKSTDVCLNDGKFEVLLIRNPQNILELRQIFYDLIHQRFQRNGNIRFFHTQKIQFRFQEETGWTVDGEYAGQPKEVCIEALHSAVRIIRKA
jgi:diacylglycerol kinase (ATP)